MKNNKNTIIIASAFAMGLVLSALILSNGVKSMKANNRFVTVRGLNEKSVKANLVVWQLNFKTTGDSLSNTQADLDKQKQIVIDFLTKSGFDKAQIQQQGIRVIDKQANEYGNAAYNTKRYILSTAVTLRSDAIDLAMKTQQKLSTLIKSGVVLSDNGYCGNTPNYLFTQLNDIKIDMLAKATQNARDAASQFAKDAQAKVGSIRRATQGYFSISALNSTQAGSGDGTHCGESESIMKKVRVVTTIDYFLE
ncbi:MAG: hypothetical protein ACJARD_000059 [Alphaproteobacteria bacterium]|jgi:hypothetical protein